MSESRRPVKLDFMSGLEKLPEHPKADEATTQAALNAGREMGFSSRVAPLPGPVPAPVPIPIPPRLDGRRLRSRGANTQMNIKVTAEEKEMILAEAVELIHNPQSEVDSIGEFVVYAVQLYRDLKSGPK